MAEKRPRSPERHDDARAHDDLPSQVQALSRQVQALSRDLREVAAKSELHVLQGELAAIRGELAAAKAALETKGVELGTARAQLDELNKLLKHERECNHELCKINVRMEGERDAARVKCHELEVGMERHMQQMSTWARQSTSALVKQEP